jgi:SAM-dependent methyltransferase
VKQYALSYLARTTSTELVPWSLDVKAPTGLKRDGTRRFYQSHPQEYADATLVRALAEVLRDFCRRLPSDGRVLDLGCGAGHDLSSITKTGRGAVGLDYAEPIARIARSISTCPVVVSDMRSIPFRDLAFDGVWASASLLHLPRRDLPTALSEIRRILRPEGRFFASVKAGSGEMRDKEGRFFALYNQDGWRRSLQEAGFAILSLESNESTLPNPVGARPERWLNSLATIA